jgi:hypothetical protein
MQLEGMQTTANTGFFLFWLRSIAKLTMTASNEEFVSLIASSSLDQTKPNNNQKITEKSRIQLT